MLKSNWILIILLIICELQAQSPDVIHIIPSPTNSNSDLACHGELLWVSSPSDNAIYMVSPLTGAQIKKLYFEDRRPYGLAFDGKDLWFSDRRNRSILQVDTAKGTIVNEFQISKQFASGIGYKNEEIYYINNLGLDGLYDTIWVMNDQGEMLDSVSTELPLLTGLCREGNYIWTSDNSFKSIYKINAQDISIEQKFDAPGGKYPNGLCFDGKYLWSSNNDSDSLYQIDVYGQGNTSTEEIPQLRNSFQVFPNPSTRYFHFQSKELKSIPQKFQISISDRKGNELIKSSNISADKMTIDLFSYPNGIYIYSIKNEEKVLQRGNILKVR